MNANTLLLRLEGPLQSWGDQESKFVVRRTGEAPTKSGVAGLLCAALGVARPDARRTLPKLNALRMAVRIDRHGVRAAKHLCAGGRQAGPRDGVSGHGNMDRNRRAVTGRSRQPTAYRTSQVSID